MITEGVILALIAILSVIVTRTFDGRQKKQDYLLTQIDELQAKVDSLILELDSWREKYYQLMIDIAKRDERIVHTEEVLIETVEGLAETIQDNE